MHRIFTPWRKEYMAGERAPGCFLCAAADAEIDRLVYQLYGLTDEEIKIVEGDAA